MIRLLDESLEELLRTEVPLPLGEIDIAFDTPNSDWTAGVTQPTVNVFLWDIRRSSDEAQTGRIPATDDGGQGYKLAPPRIAFRYYITAWASDVRDEHQILGAVLATLLPIRVMPEQYLSRGLADVKPPPAFRVATADAKDYVDFWSALDDKLKAGIDLIATATIDTGILVAAGAQIGAASVGTSDLQTPGRTSRAERRGGRVSDESAVGAVVRAPEDATLVSSDGRFWIIAASGDEIVVDTDPPKSVMVPESGPIVVDG